MAEALGVPASVATLVDVGIKVLGGLVKYCSDYAGQDATITKTTARLESLMTILKDVKDYAHCSSFAPDSRNVAQIQSCVRDCTRSIQELKAQFKKYKQPPSSSLRSKFGVAKQRALYPFHMGTLEKLDKEIGELRANVQAAISVLGVNLLDRIRNSQVSGEMCSWLNASDTYTEHSDAQDKRQHGTGAWFIDGPAFRNWLEQENSLLWINGFAGCGKSVLCSNAIDRTIELNQAKSDVAVAFYYFTFREQRRQEAGTMLRALLLQLATQLVGGEGQSILKRLYDQHGPRFPPTRTLINHIRYIIAKFRRVYILIDAVDECPLSQQRHVLNAVAEIRRQLIPGLHCLLTSRDEENIRTYVMHMQASEMKLRNAEIDKDIAKFIWQQLRKDPGLGQWKDSHERIYRELAYRAKGVFRLAECHLEELRYCPPTQRQLDKCLRSLPEGLDDTYERILCSIREDSRQMARRMLILLCFAGRPLAEAELLDALAIRVTNPVGLVHGDRLKNHHQLRKICPGLIEFYPIKRGGSTEMIARIAHFSVQEYLVSGRIQDPKAACFAIRDFEAHAEIAEVCCTYIKEPGLPRSEQKSQTFTEYPLAEFAASFWYHHYARATSAKQWLQDQMLAVFTSLPDAFHAWRSLEDRNMPLPLKEQYFPNSALCVAAWLGLERIVYQLMTPKDRTRRPSKNTCGAALLGPACAGHNGIMKMLLDSGADPNHRVGMYGFPLCAAAYFGHEEIVTMLLHRGADVNATGGAHANALYAAAEEGHERIVQVLLNYGADINTCNYGASDQSALEGACFGGHEEVVRTLLSRGADLHYAGRRKGEALYMASSQGRERVVGLLLDAGAEVDAQHPKSAYRTALQAASAQGHGRVVQMLLARGADVNAQSGFYGNALLAASDGAHEKVVQVLLDAGANVNARGGYCDYALIAASRNGGEEAVRTLLRYGANVNVVGKDYGTAVEVAEAMQHRKVVQTLLNYGAARSGRRTAASYG